MLNVKDYTEKTVQTALLTGLIFLATVIIRVPVPFTQGYVHLGDAVIFMAVIVLGCRRGALAAALASALADIIGGFAMWAPWSFAIKGGMAIVAGLVIAGLAKTKAGALNGICTEITGFLLGGIFMTGGYFVAEWFTYGSAQTAAIEIPWNIAQMGVGTVIAVILSGSLAGTPVGKLFKYKFRPAK
ncbi:MAG: ECF transporter S component [Clostridia bacterium]|nr:ECF transporter S component [Clostridia bacterium]